LKQLIFLILCSFLVSCVTRQPSYPEKTEQVVRADHAAGIEEEVSGDETKDAGGTEELEAEALDEQDSSDISQDPVEPPLKPSEIEEYIRDSALDGYFPVHRKGTLVWTAYDLYGNGLDDYFVLFVEADSTEAAEVGVLADMENLYSPDVFPPQYYLQAFLQEPGRIFKGKRVALGRKQVFSSLFPLRISIQRRRPFAVLAEFLTTDSIRTEWIIYSNAGISRFSTGKTLTVTPRVEDIDGNGLVDIIIQEKILEEGTGFETYLTWYRWKGDRYGEYMTTNIVRNLKAFLDSCSIHMAAREWKEFCTFALSKQDMSSLRSYGYSYSRIMDRVLAPSAEEGEEMPPRLTSLPEIKSVVFPQLMEDPFLMQTGRSLFPVFVNVVSGGSSYLYHGTILLNDNPFSSPQFSFVSGN